MTIRSLHRLHRRVFPATIVLALAFLVFFRAEPGWAQYKLYVTDQFQVTCRNGPGTEYRIIKMLGSGDRVEFLSEAEGWTQVRLNDGKVGWVLTRWLVREEPASLAAERFKRQNKTLKEAADECERQLEAVQTENRNLSSELEGVASFNQTLKSDYATLSEECKDFISLKESHEAVSARYTQLEKEYSRVKLERDQSFRRHLWMVYGAGIFIFGLLVGALSRRMRSTKRRGTYLRM